MRMQTINEIRMHVAPSESGPQTSHHLPLYKVSFNMLWRTQVGPQVLLMLMAAYGKPRTLQNRSITGIYCRSVMSPALQCRASRWGRRCACPWHLARRRPTLTASSRRA